MVVPDWLVTGALVVVVPVVEVVPVAPVVELVATVAAFVDLGDVLAVNVVVLAEAPSCVRLDVADATAICTLWLAVSSTVCVVGGTALIAPLAVCSVTA